MLMKCAAHGLAPGIEVSPDLAELIDSKKSGSAIEITYVYRGDSCLRVLVSAPFARQERIVKSGPLPLPDDYPAWHLALQPRCELCSKDLLSYSQPESVPPQPEGKDQFP